MSTNFFLKVWGGEKKKLSFRPKLKNMLEISFLLLYENLLSLKKKKKKKLVTLNLVNSFQKLEFVNLFCEQTGFFLSCKQSFSILGRPLYYLYRL